MIHYPREIILLFGEINWTGLATDGKDIDVTHDGEEVETVEAEKYLQWIGLKVGAIFLVGGK